MKTIGAEVTGIEQNDLLQDESIVAAVMDALEENGVLVFRDLDLGPETQVAFCRRMGELDYSEGHHPVAGIYRVTRDPTKIHRLNTSKARSIGTLTDAPRSTVSHLRRRRS